MIMKIGIAILVLGVIATIGFVLADQRLSLSDSEEYGTARIIMSAAVAGVGALMVAGSGVWWAVDFVRAMNRLH